jgi:lipoyl(octanoyl) transferase
VTSAPATSSDFTVSTVIVRDLGRMDYLRVWQDMRAFTDQRDANTRDEIWLVEHPPVYTLGTNDRNEPFENPGIPLVKSDRGGQITYHGPGQLIAYVLIDLRRRGWGIRQLVTRLEQSIIDLLAARGLSAVRRTGAPGVYVDGRKIAQLGLRVRHGACYHGLSFNVAMDLEPFRRIKPCGYAGLETIDLATLIGHERVRMPDVRTELLAQLLRNLGYNLQQRPESIEINILADF